MKQIKFLMVAVLTLVMGLSMTSCLNSDSSESTFDWGGVYRIQSSMGRTYFLDMAGNTYVPTSASLALMESNYGFDPSDSRFAMIYFKWVESTEQTDGGTDGSTTTPQTRDIELVSASNIIDGEMAIVQTEADLDIDAPETAPIITLEPTDAYGNASAQPALFDLDNLLLPIYFNLDGNTEDYEKHKLVLACNMGEVLQEATELVLYVRHDKGDDDSRTHYVGSWYAYDISYAVAQFEQKAGNTPTKLIVKAHEDEYQSGEMPDDYTEYEIEYKLPTEE